MKSLSALLTLIIQVLRIIRYLSGIRRIRVILLLLPFASSAQIITPRGGETEGNSRFTEIAPGEWAQYKYDDFNNWWMESLTTGERFNDIGDTDIPYIEIVTASRYLFDTDSEIEYLYYDYGIQSLRVSDSGESFQGDLLAILPYKDRAKLITTEREYILPGRLPGQSGDNSGSTPDTVYIERTTRDTVYLTETISRIDTVRELITERIFTFDTIYVNEIVTLEGDVDTVFINRTVTTRDTVYSITENTIYQTSVDSVYLLGADYLNDLNTVTGVDPRFEAQNDLLVPYPSPSDDYVTITYTSLNQVPMTLAIYDNQGRRQEKFTVKGYEDEVTVDVRNYAPGVYVCVAYRYEGKTTTRKFIVR